MKSINEIEDILSRVNTMNQVDGYIITNKKGEIIKTTYLGEKKSQGDRIIANIPDLVVMAQASIKNINEGSNLQLMRLKTKLNELLITPDKNGEYIFIVVQSLNIKRESESNDI